MAAEMQRARGRSEAAMLIVAADDRGAARRRPEAVLVDLLEGLRRGPGVSSS